jgi:hypothetical protein
MLIANTSFPDLLLDGLYKFKPQMVSLAINVLFAFIITGADQVGISPLFAAAEYIVKLKYSVD